LQQLQPQPPLPDLVADGLRRLRNPITRPVLTRPRQREWHRLVGLTEAVGDCDPVLLYAALFDSIHRVPAERDISSRTGSAAQIRDKCRVRSSWCFRPWHARGQRLATWVRSGHHWRDVAERGARGGPAIRWPHPALPFFSVLFARLARSQTSGSRG